MEKQCKLCIRELSKFGFKFQPSDQEICELYLKLMTKDKKQQLPCIHLITEEKLYEDYSTPWEIFKNDDPRWLISSESSNNNKKKIKKTIYVLTMLKKKGERIIRKAGCGCWTGQNNKVVMNEYGVVIGSNRLLTFEIKDKMMMDNDNGSHGNWTMHEFCLKPCDNNYALCKITKEEDVVEKAGSADYTQKFDRPLSSSNTQDNTQVLSSDHISATVTLPDQNMQLNRLENLDGPVPPQLVEDLDSFAQELDKLLEPQQEEEGSFYGEVQESLNENNMPNQSSPAVLEEVVVNQVAHPRADKEEGLITNTSNYYFACGSFLQLPDPVNEMPNELDNVPDDIEPQQNNIEEVIDVEVADDDQEFNNVPVDQQQQSNDEIPLSDLCEYIAADFDYFYGLQQQQQELEDSQPNLPGKRKDRSYAEEFFSSNKRQQLPYSGLL